MKFESRASERSSEFIRYRPLLFAIAYRMLGSVMEAEDVVQEAFLRWQPASEHEIGSTKAYLTTITTHLCLDHLKRAYVKREEYPGPWLPEPVMIHTPEMLAGDEDSLSFAFLILLERLSPVERAAFLLREVFDYGYDELADILAISKVNCRQIVHRARKLIKSERQRSPVKAAEQEKILRRFLEACRNGDLDQLLDLLKEDVAAWTDGGGKVRALPNIIQGIQKVARLCLGFTKRNLPALQIGFTRVNHQPALIVLRNRRLHHVLILDVIDAKVQNIFAILNPDKLQDISWK